MKQRGSVRFRERNAVLLASSASRDIDRHHGGPLPHESVKRW